MMAEPAKPLLIKRYASRRLYNTETSDYVTLEDIAGFIRAGREVQIVDLKSGDDLTRQYLLQIVAEHESKGENVLPINVLTDLVRSYTTEVQSVVTAFNALLAAADSNLATTASLSQGGVRQVIRRSGFHGSARSGQSQGQPSNPAAEIPQAYTDILAAIQRDADSEASTPSLNPDELYRIADSGIRLPEGLDGASRGN